MSLQAWRQQLSSPICPVNATRLTPRHNMHCSVLLWPSRVTCLPHFPGFLAQKPWLDMVFYRLFCHRCPRPVASFMDDETHGRDRVESCLKKGPSLAIVRLQNKGGGTLPRPTFKSVRKNHGYQKDSSWRCARRR